MLNKLNTSLTLLISAALFSSCCKDVDIPGSNCIAGKGDVRVVLFPEHHEEPIPGILNYPDSAFIKFNTNEYPGEAAELYDLVIVGEIGDEFVVVDSLGCGQYFIYMTGFDTSIAERVKGGIPYFIEENTGNIEIKIPVTED